MNPFSLLHCAASAFFHVTTSYAERLGMIMRMMPLAGLFSRRSSYKKLCGARRASSNVLVFRTKTIMEKEMTECMVVAAAATDEAKKGTPSYFHHHVISLFMCCRQPNYFCFFFASFVILCLQQLLRFDPTRNRGDLW